MTFAEDLARLRQRKNLVLSVVVDGIPIAFMERTVGTLHSSSTGRTQCVCLTSVVEGETLLNLKERREEAPTLSLSMTDPDGTLATLFAVSRFRATYLDADITTSSTSVTVGEVGSLVAGDHVYIDDETITLGTRSVSTFASCTRGAFNSTAAQHEDDSAGYDGASIYVDSPPSWVGRRAYLVGYTLAGDGVTVLNSDIMGAFVVDATPRHEGDNRWSMQLAGAMQDFTGRSVGVGLREARQIGTLQAFTNDGASITVDVNDALAFRLGTGVTAYAIVEWGDGKTPIMAIEDVDLSPYSVTFATREVWGTGESTGLDRFEPGVIMRPVGIIGGPSPIPVLAVLISDEGQGASTHDRLPGRKPTFVGDLGWRLGAAIAPALIDTATWEALTGLTNTTIVVDDERPLGDVLREWCLLNDAIVTTTSAGLLSVRRMTDRVGTPTSLGDDDIVPGQVVIMSEEDQIFPVLTVKCGYSPQDGEFKTTLNLVDTDLAKRYPRSVRREEVELRSVDSIDTRALTGRWTHPSAMTTGEVQQSIADVMRGASMGGPRRLVKITTTLKHYALRVGDSVTLDMTPAAYADAPNMRGGTLSGDNARVVGRRPDYARGTMDLTLELVDALVHVLPAAVITNAAGAVMTLGTTGDEVASATPELDFFVGARVFVVDRSQVDTDDSIAVEEFTVSSISSSPPRITLSGTPTFVIETGVDYIVLSPQVAGTTTSGYATTELVQVTQSGDDVDGDRFG